MLGQTCSDAFCVSCDDRQKYGFRMVVTRTLFGHYLQLQAKTNNNKNKTNNDFREIYAKNDNINLDPHERAKNIVRTKVSI